MRTPFLGIVLSVLSVVTPAQSLEVIGYAGGLGEWELAASVIQGEQEGAYSGAVTMTHVGVCTQDGPEQKTGEIRLRIAASQLNATLLLGGVECTYSARLSDAYKGQMSCPDRPPVALTLFVK
jgi:hypothetical protein